MSLKVTFPGGKFESKNVKALKKGMPKNLPFGLQAAARELKNGVKKELKQGLTKRPFKSSHTKLRSRDGTLRASITTDPTSGAKGSGHNMYVMVGPGGLAAKYGAIHETGGRIRVTKRMRWFLGLSKGIWLRKGKKYIVIPKREWFAPSIKKYIKVAIRRLAKMIFKPLRKR